MNENADSRSMTPQSNNFRVVEEFGLVWTFKELNEAISRAIRTVEKRHYRTEVWENDSTLLLILDPFGYQDSEKYKDLEGYYCADIEALKAKGVFLSR